MERVGNEFLFGEVGTFPVTATHAFPANVKLTRYANRHQLLIFIQDINLCVEYGLANNYFFYCSWKFVNARPDSCFRWSVHIPNSCACIMFQLPYKRKRCSFAANEQQAQ